MHNLVRLSLALSLTVAGCTDQSTEPIAGDTPMTQITSAPSEDTYDRFASIEFEGERSASFECRLNDGEWAQCESPLVLTNLSMGTQTVRVRGVSSQGQTDPSPATAEWEIVSVFGARGAPLVHEGSIPPPDPHGGSFRIQCGVSHYAYDDPIVFPGRPGRAHLHMFFGNEQSDFSSTVESMFTTGTSTCHGDALNRSSYWIPSVLTPRFDEAGGARTHPNGQPVLSVVHPLQAPHVYYKSSVDDLSSIQSLPYGLRMIKGDPGVTGPVGEEKLYDIRWYCESWSLEGRIRSHRDFAEHIPRCAVGDWVNLFISFPECWDGVNLDTDDHSSHVARFIHSAQGLVCPASHPVPIPKISYTFFFGVTDQNAGPEGDSRHWRVASDAYEVDPDTRPGGYSIHADWFMAWHPEIMDSAVEHCIRAGRDCSGGEIGNGWRLSWFREGTHRLPSDIHQGHGHGGH